MIPTIPEARFRRHNGPKCYRLDFTPQGLDALQTQQRSIQGLPGFIDAVLHLNPASTAVQFFLQEPGYIHWSEDGSVLIQPNFPFAPSEMGRVPISELRNLPAGFSLGAWYIHPKQLEKTVFADAKYRRDFLAAVDSVEYVPSLEPKINIDRRPGQETIEALEAVSGVTYLASLLDLQPQHLPWLKNLKTTILSHLTTQYCINDHDKVDLFFHPVNGPYTTTLHLHIKVNEGLHPFEHHKALRLDGVIEGLENGITTKEMMLARSPYFDTIETEQQAAFITTIPHVSTTIVDNPFVMEEPTGLGQAKSWSLMQRRDTKKR